MFWDNFVSLCSNNGKSTTAVVLELGLSRSLVTNWKNGTTPNNTTLLKIANHFGVTVDYLLGKTEIQNGNIVSGNYNVVGNSNSSINVNKEDLTEQETEMLKCFRALSVVQKAKALIYLADLKEGK